MITVKRIVFSCFIVFIWTLLFPCPDVDCSGPIIEIEEPIFHHKQVTQGQVIKHDFKVYNKGIDLLEIKDVRPG